jgi:act minimal PKS acyl carrier protein
MDTIDIDDVRRLMRDSGGVEETVDLDGDIADVAFDELGYDSLARLELAGRLQRKYQVSVPDEAFLDLRTPGQTVEFINHRLAESRA